MDTQYKQGYKQTEVGLIPEEWEVVELNSIGKIVTGSTPSTFDRTNYGNDFLFVSPVDLGYGKYIVKTEKMLSSKGFSISRKYPKNSVLYTCIGSTIGKLGIASTTLTSNQQINAVIADESIMSFEFLYYSLDFLTPKIKSLAGEQAVPLVNKTQFGLNKIPLPPLPEQTAIASALSDMDALIAQTEKLIEKKKAIKQGVMQELLTGKKRLKGFENSKGYKQTEVGVIPEDWEVKFIKQVAPLQRGFDLPTKDIKTGPFPVVYSNGIVNYHNDFKVKKPGVVTGRSGTIGKITFVEKDYWPHNTSLWVTNFFENDPKFVFYLFNNLRIERFASGSGVPTLNRNDVHDFKIPLPPLPEQTAIASASSDIDEDIRIREAKLNKLKLQKQGMMQALLTGKIRLV